MNIYPSSMNVLKLKAVPNENRKENVKRETVDLGNGSDVVYIQRLIPSDQSWKWFQYLDEHIPWTKPTIRVFGKSFLQVHIISPFLSNSTHPGTSDSTKISSFGVYPLEWKMKLLTIFLVWKYAPVLRQLVWQIFI